MATCNACAARNFKPGGLYDLACLHCCADLVLSAYPNKVHAASMLQVIERTVGSPGRARVLALVNQKITKLHSATKKSSLPLSEAC